jgi:Tfp pilus assembly protein PilN
MAVPAFLRPLLRFGTGVAIEIDGPKGSESLQIAVVRVRPSGASLLAHYTVEDFLNQPAGVWGAEYAAFLKKLGIPHVAATVLLPRSEVILRLLALPGVGDKDLANAIQFQMDGLHPYREEDVVTSWSRLPETDSVLVGIARREPVERYLTAFAEAGIKVRSFSTSAAVLHSALRLFGNPAYAEVLATRETADGGVEIYAESPVKPLLSSLFALPPDRAVALASAELRFAQPPQPMSFEALVGTAPALPFAAGLTAACPRLALPLNLLPESMRQSTSLMAWVPSAALAAVVLLLAGALFAYPRIDENRERRALGEELTKIQPMVTRANDFDRQIADAQKRTAQLDTFRKRAKADMDVLAELTKLLPPPAWLNLLELTERQVVISGEADQAAPLLRVLDESPLFVSSEFNLPPIRIAGGDGRRAGEAFRIRVNRDGPALVIVGGKP